MSARFLKRLGELLKNETAIIWTIVLYWDPKHPNLADQEQVIEQTLGIAFWSDTLSSEAMSAQINIAVIEGKLVREDGHTVFPSRGQRPKVHTDWTSSMGTIAIWTCTQPPALTANQVKRTAGWWCIRIALLSFPLTSPSHVLPHRNHPYSRYILLDHSNLISSAVCTASTWIDAGSLLSLMRAH